ncbi:MAG: hypothetical protein IT374_17850 [Polyangiaceae bacterium]|nr:hypothetical protein [Polyangiaceae bacterium]
MNRSLLSRRVTPLISFGALVGSALLSEACLDRPLAPSTPQTTNTVTEKVVQTVVDKIDLLFVVDNSASMLDKQKILARAVPDLVERLINPTCVDSKTKAPAATQPANPTDPCPAGAEREFNPIDDIHIGIVSSSLGGHGSPICGDLAKGQDDKGHLVTRKATNLWADTGFFFWDPTQSKAPMGMPPGLKDPNVLKTSFTEAVKGVDQTGCGFEATLESMYRFLIEPNPPAAITRDPGASVDTPATVDGTDQVILKQRADFLRPDSLVAIIVLSDENDCSVMDGVPPADVCNNPKLDENGIAVECTTPREPWPKDSGFTATPFPASYLVSASGTPVRSGSEQCKTNPNDPACQSCYYLPDGTPGCGLVPKEDDYVGLRCWNQKQRYGVDMLYPVQKYVDGLSAVDIYDRNGFKVPNPLYKAGKRTPAIVYFAGIVGVPWQDLARKGTDGKPDLKLGYASADGATYDRVLGTPEASPPIPPLDTLMVEAVTSRFKPGLTHVVTGEPLEDGKWNSVNGSEYESYKQDLMFACIFPLPKEEVDAQNCNAGNCADCQDPGSVDNNVLRKDGQATMPLAKDSKNPLCAPPVDAANPSGPGQYGKYDAKQYRAKAYPGLRFLDVMKRYGEKSIPASICAANVTDPSAPDYGYRPAVATIVDRLKEGLKPKCLPRQIKANPDGSTPCLIIDARFRKPDKGQTADYTPAEVAECKQCGDTQRRRKLDPALESSLTGEVKNYECLCEVLQLTGPALDTCQGDPVASNTSTGQGGWCYVDPVNGAPAKAELIAGATEIVKPCGGGDAAHTIRFLDANTQNTSLFITCLGAASGTTKESSGAGGSTGAAGSGSAGAGG